MARNTLTELKVGINRLGHLYDAFRRSGDPAYAKKARRLLKSMRKQFKEVGREMGISEDMFHRMMHDD
jgi:hypothetical protein